MMNALLSFLLYLSLIMFLMVNSKYRFRRVIGDDFTGKLKQEFNLSEKEKYEYFGSRNGYCINILILKPSNNLLFDSVTIRVIIDYKPLDLFTEQEKRILKLKKKYNEYSWVANVMIKDLKYFIKKANVMTIFQTLTKMNEILNHEKLLEIDCKESEIYGDKWDYYQMTT